MGNPSKSIGTLVKRYAAVVLFPTITVSSIYADYRHTYLWKKSLAEGNKENLASN